LFTLWNKRQFKEPNQLLEARIVALMKENKLRIFERYDPRTKLAEIYLDQVYSKIREFPHPTLFCALIQGTAVHALLHEIGLENEKVIRLIEWHLIGQWLADEPIHIYGYLLSKKFGLPYIPHLIKEERI